MNHARKAKELLCNLLGIEDLHSTKIVDQLVEHIIEAAKEPEHVVIHATDDKVDGEELVDMINLKRSMTNREVLTYEAFLPIIHKKYAEEIERGDFVPVGCNTNGQPVYEFSFDQTRELMNI